MVVCTFLEAYDLKDKVIVPFFTYSATTYLNESMQKIYKITPDSKHIPETLPEDLDSDDITVPGRPDDAGIDMPGNANGTEAWLRRIVMYDFDGKTVIPFCTHEGSGLSATEKYIADTCEGARVEKGLAVRGVTAQHEPEQAGKAVVRWLERLSLMELK